MTARDCVVCRASFQPAKRSHLLCFRCWTWLAGGAGIHELLQHVERVAPGAMAR